MIELALIVLGIAVGVSAVDLYRWYRQHQEFKRHEEEGL